MATAVITLLATLVSTALATEPSISVPFMAVLCAIGDLFARNNVYHLISHHHGFPTFLISRLVREMSGSNYFVTYDHDGDVTCLETVESPGIYRLPSRPGLGCILQVAAPAGEPIQLSLIGSTASCRDGEIMAFCSTLQVLSPGGERINMCQTIAWAFNNGARIIYRTSWPTKVEVRFGEATDCGSVLRTAYPSEPVILHNDGIHPPCNVAVHGHAPVIWLQAKETIPTGSVSVKYRRQSYNSAASYSQADIGAIGPQANEVKFYGCNDVVVSVTGNATVTVTAMEDPLSTCLDADVYCCSYPGLGSFWGTQD